MLIDDRCRMVRCAACAPATIRAAPRALTAERLRLEPKIELNQGSRELEGGEGVGKKWTTFFLLNVIAVDQRMPIYPHGTDPMCLFLGEH